MINETIEIDAFTPEIVREQIKLWSRSLVLSEEAVALLISFLEADDEVRREFMEAIPAFVCAECGQPSCLHGYSDE